MTFTYNGGTATPTNRDRVRFLLGDTDSSDPLLTDSEVDSCLSYRISSTTGGTVYNIPAAAADGAGAIAAKFSRRFNFSTEDQRFDLAQRVSHYLALEQDLRSRAGGVSVAYAAGTAIT